MSEKRKYGQYFTVSPIAEYMVKLITHSRKSKILEPSCGKGVFLDSLIQNGFSNISAYEIDKSLDTKHNFVKYESFLSIPTSEKYDVVIGNPPYIRWKNLESILKEELKQNKIWNKYFNSLCDYLFIFILKSIEHLNDDGELIYICSDYWLNTTHSSSLRNYMCQNGYFTEIYHFKEAPLFEKVTASFMIFRYVKKKKPTKNKTIKFYRYNKSHKLPLLEELENNSCFDALEIPHFKQNERWLLATKQEQSKLEKFLSSCKKQEGLFGQTEFYRIGDFCDIGNGMVSGLDKAFQIQNINKLNTDEQKHIITVIKAKDLLPYNFKATTKYIFLQENIEPEIFEQKYPNFFEHFKPFKEELLQRYSYGKQIPYWEFVFSRNQGLFERKQPRIFVPCKERISNKNYFRFSLINQMYYPTQDVTAIFKKKNVRESIEYLLAYLNNERVFYWLKYNGIVKGDIVEFSESPIANIPFKPINWDSAQEVYIHNKITEEVQNYINDTLSERIERIDKYFNELFGYGS